MNLTVLNLDNSSPLQEKKLCFPKFGTVLKIRKIRGTLWLERTSGVLAQSPCLKQDHREEERLLRAGSQRRGEVAQSLAQLYFQVSLRTETP